MIASMHDVSLRYNTHWALAHINLQIHQGRTHLITGENGAGKTSLLRVLGTALKPTLGTVEIGGHKAHEEPNKARALVCLVSHQHYFYESFSGLENLQWISRLSGLQHPKNVLCQHMLSAGLNPEDGKAVSDYSAGMKRRLCFARTALLKPSLLLLDEPFGQLDPEGVSYVTQTLHAYRAQGVSIVFASHDIERSMALADTHIHMEKGRIQSVTDTGRMP